jgi:hypothetical protein
MTSSKKEELRRLIVRSNQQFKSSKTWSEFVGKCKYPSGYLHQDVQHLLHHADYLLNRL